MPVHHEKEHDRIEGKREREKVASMPYRKKKFKILDQRSEAKSGNVLVEWYEVKINEVKF